MTTYKLKYTGAEIDNKLDAVDNKQDKLTAGDGITISENNIISVVGGGTKLYKHTFYFTITYRGEKYDTLSGTLISTSSVPATDMLSANNLLENALKVNAGLSNDAYASFIQNSEHYWIFIDSQNNAIKSLYKLDYEFRWNSEFDSDAVTELE